MAYSVGQYNYLRSATENVFSTYITDGVADIISYGNDVNVTNSSGGSTPITFSFNNPFLRLGSPLEQNQHYYFHGKIKRLNTVQNFYVRLISTDTTVSLKQYIIPLEVNAAVENSAESIDINNMYVDVEFIFTPYAAGFNGILFELQRTSDDFILEEDSKIKGREPIIGYVELSKLNNIIGNFSGLNDNTELLKIGIQSRPNLLVCINGEEIRLPRSGVFELRDGIVTTSFFSVANASRPLGTDQLTNQMNEETVTSKSFLSSTDYKKVKIIDGFTVDYIYQS